MVSTFETIRKLGPAAFVLKAIVAAVVADALLLGFILLRRAYRARFFAKRDARVFEFRHNWDGLISGKVPYDTWRKKPFDLRIVEAIVLDAFEAAGREESARLLNFLRKSGLIDRLIFDAHRLRGWRRRRALVSLGRTRAPEGISALAEGLRDRDAETRLAALRGLSRTACPQAAEEILLWVGEVGLTVPPLPLQGALIQCCAECPQLLLPYLHHAEGPTRELLGRVLGAVATPSLATELLEFAGDHLDELRAAAARALSHVQPGLALDALGELARDPIWFVRLRAIVSLGTLNHPGAVPLLIHGITDANRLVRLRAAEGLVDFKTEMVPTFAEVVATRDLYGLHAYLTALENAGLGPRLKSELENAEHFNEHERRRLLAVLGTGILAVELPEQPAAAPVGTSFRS
jgi:HEAT repeat protein